jgi:thiol-disulfide isomerase/thioredoxin
MRDAMGGALKILHFSAKWCPFCPASERAFEMFRDKHPRIQAELVDIDLQPDVANRYHIDAVPSDVIVGGSRPLHDACYTLDEFEAFWRTSTERPDKAAPAKKPAQKKPAKKAKKVAKKPAKKKPAHRPAPKAKAKQKKPAKKAKHR